MTKSTANLIGYYAAFLSIGIAAATLGPTLPSLMIQTGVGLSQISILLAVRPIGYLMSTLIVGRIYDHTPGNPVLAVAAGGLALGLALVPLAPWLWLMIVVMLVIGMFEAAVDIGGNTLIVWTFGEKVEPYMNGLHFMFGLGAFIAPLVVAGALWLTGGVSWAYWILAALIAPSVVWLLRLPSPPVRTAAQAGLHGPVNYWLVALISFCFFLYTGAEISFGAWIFTYAKTLGLADETVAAYLTSAFWGALTVGRLVSIPLTSRFRLRTIIMGSLIGSVIGVALPLFITGSVIAIWAGSLLTGLSMAAIFPTLVTFGERRLSLTGHIASFFFIGASLGGMVLPWIIGQLFERLGPQVTMVSIFGDLVVAVIVFAILIRLTPRPQVSA
jgi:MFS transporter, FHS family, Na+ dependent glucose transporter 1